MKEYDKFKQYLINVKKSSSNTVESYMRDIAQYSDYCAAEKTDILSADNGVLRGYLEYLTAIGKSDATKTRVTASVRCFYRFLIAEGTLKRNPADGIKLQRTEKKLPGILDYCFHSPTAPIIKA